VRCADLFFFVLSWQKSGTFSVVTDFAVAKGFCLGDNLTLLEPLRGKIVGLPYPTAFGLDAAVTMWRCCCHCSFLQVPFLHGGCAWERMISVAAKVRVAAMVFFDDTINSQSGVAGYSVCHNCSIFTGEPITFPSVRLFGLESYSAPLLFDVYLPFINGAPNISQPVAPPDVEVVMWPDVSYFEYVNETLGYALQVVYSLWAAANVTLVVIYMSEKMRKKQWPWLAIIALSFEGICNLWRFSFLVVDPWLSNSVYPFQYFAVIGGFLYSLSCSATWVIAFFWFRYTFLARKDRWDALSVILIVVGVLLLLASEFVPRALTISSISFFDLIKASRVVLVVLLKCLL
jgi:hypothetical protein